MAFFGFLGPVDGRPVHTKQFLAPKSQCQIYACIRREETVLVRNLSEALGLPGRDEETPGAPSLPVTIVPRTSGTE